MLRQSESYVRNFTLFHRVPSLFSLKALVTTVMELSAIAMAAIMGLSLPAAARGKAAML
jgi:hypothetical protein